MDLKTLLQPGGDPWKAIPYALAFSLLGASGPLVVALQYRDWMWAMDTVAFSIVLPLVILGLGYALWGLFGTRLAPAAGLAIAVVAGCVAAQALSLYVSEVLLGFEPHPGKGYLYRLGLIRGPLLWWIIAAAAWYTVKRADARAAEVSRAQLAGDELRASTAEARLQALQAQVEPHFLFNTLAHVKWLYRRDPERGRRMLDRLLDYLHAALPRVRQAATTLDQELQLTRAYLDIHQLRIGGRLAVTIEVPEEIARLRFPPLMLLTLVENAIKHGIAPQTEGGSIAIRAYADERQLRIEVRDTGAGLTQAAGTGMGLANVRERLTPLFGAGARLVIEPNMPRGVVAAIEIPR
jgi:signal transduction histidine kinase